MYEIEMAIIGCLIMWHEELSCEQISEDDFGDAICREIFVAIKNSDRFDLTLLLAQLSEEAKVAALQASETYAVSMASFNSYLCKLKENANSRRIKNSLYSLVMTDGLVNSDMLIEIAEGNKNLAVTGYAEKAKGHLKGFAERAVAEVPKVDTGWGGLDKIIGGLRIPAVSIIGALPSTGKTSLALNIAHTQLMENKKTVIFSLEMSADMIYERLACIFMDFDYQKFNNRQFDAQDKKDLARFQELLSCLNLYVFDDVYDIETQSLIINQIKPDFVAVDYVQKVTSKQKGESRRAEIEYISGQYKQIANRCNCHIMLLSQLSRGSDSTPTMRNLKESGALEADGDYVMILNRPYVQNKREHKPNETELLIDKNKFGGTGMLEMSFEGKHQKFYEVTYADS